jgi:hypothetical protein
VETNWVLLTSRCFASPSRLRWATTSRAVTAKIGGAKRRYRTPTTSITSVHTITDEQPLRARSSSPGGGSPGDGMRSSE